MGRAGRALSEGFLEQRKPEKEIQATVSLEILVLKWGFAL